jgi:hypothetical protein
MRGRWLRSGTGDFAAPRDVARGGEFRRALGGAFRKIAQRIGKRWGLAGGRRLGVDRNSLGAAERNHPGRFAATQPICTQNCGEADR